jgi:hypothetical protein
MGNQVYANGNEIACKAAAGKSAAATPDTCLSPPSPPAGPVPIPYPNTSFASDTTKGTTTVMISGQEVMMKDHSTFKKSTGDEAATKSLGMGVVTHCIQGEASFVAWSMDVLFEGANVDRHLDQMLHNEQCDPANTTPWIYLDQSAFGKEGACGPDREKMEQACSKDKDGKPARHCPGALNVGKTEQKNKYGGDVGKAGAAAEADASKKPEGEKWSCAQAQRCYLRPYKSETKDQCCPGQTGHHIPPKACFKPTSNSAYQAGYTMGSALCVCMEGQDQHSGSHGKNHAAIEWLAKQQTPELKPDDPCDAKKYNAMCAQTVEAQCGCKKECIEAQLNEQSKQNGVTEVRHASSHSNAGVSDELQGRIRESAGLPVNASSSG